MARIWGGAAHLLVILIARVEGAVHLLQAQTEVRHAVQPHHPPGRDVLHACGRHGSAATACLVPLPQPPPAQEANPPQAPPSSARPRPRLRPARALAPPPGRQQAAGRPAQEPFCSLGSVLAPPEKRKGEVKKKSVSS